MKFLVNGSRTLRCVVMRGGTSRGLFFHEGDLPRDSALRDRILMAAIGGPDPRQVDGLGGADLLLSKIAVVRTSKRMDVDVECRFGSVTPGSAMIKYGANCGNLASAVACFAREEGLVHPDSDMVRLYNPDSDAIMEANFQPLWSEDVGCAAASQGMPPTGHCVELSILNPAGTATQALLPTGRARDDLKLPGGGKIAASIVDAGALYVFVRGDELRFPQANPADPFGSHQQPTDIAEYLRGQAAVLTGLASNVAEAVAVTPTVPKLALVSPPGERSDVHLFGRIISNQSFHKAYAVTGAIATTAAAIVEGSVVNELVGVGENPETERRLHIGHPSGVIECALTFRRAGKTIQIDRATLWRTARRIMAGEIHLPEAADETARLPSAMEIA